MNKTTVEVWRVNDIDSFGAEVCIGTFRTIKDFALEVYDTRESNYKRSHIETGDEQTIFSFLGEYNYDVEHLCDVKIEEFNK